jgi:hypothetical protein
VVAPGVTLHGCDTRMIETQVKLTDQLPNRTRAMIFFNQILYINRMQQQLRTINRC